MEKRKVGRPMGSRKCDDTKHLHTIADLKIADSCLSNNAAFKRVALQEFEEHNRPKAIKRFERAWKKSKDKYLEAAQHRAKQKRELEAIDTSPSTKQSVFRAGRATDIARAGASPLVTEMMARHGNALSISSRYTSSLSTASRHARALSIASRYTSARSISFHRGDSGNLKHYP